MGGAWEEVIATSTEGGTMIIIIEVVASMRVQIITRIKEQADMIMKGIVKVVHMEGDLLSALLFLVQYSVLCF